MKRLSIRPVLALLGVSLAMAAIAAGPTAPAAPPKHTGPGREYFEEAGFSFAPPAAWDKATPTAPCFMAYFRPPAKDGFTVNMNTIVQPADADDLDEALADMKNQLAVLFPDYEAQDDGKTTVNGRAAVYLSGLFTAGGRRIQNLQYCIQGGNGKFYVVTFTTTPEDFARDRADFEKIAKTIITD